MIRVGLLLLSFLKFKAPDFQFSIIAIEMLK